MLQVRKALLIPLNPDNKVLIQDRENYKPPRWGYFGGSIEGDETPTQAVIREAKEELDLDLMENDLKPIGIFINVIDDSEIERHAFLLYTELKPEKLKVFEGKAAQYFSLDDAKKLMLEFASETDADIITAVKSILEVN